MIEIKVFALIGVIVLAVLIKLYDYNNRKPTQKNENVTKFWRDR